MSTHHHFRALSLAVLTLSSVVALAQVGKLTAEDQKLMSGGGQRRAAETDTKTTRKPSADPHDISGTWSEMNPSGGGPGGGGPGGGGGGMGGGAPPSGGAGGGAFGGGGPGGPGGAGGPGGSGGPGGGGGGNAPGGAPPSGGPGGGAPEANSKIQCLPSFSSFGGVEGVVDITQTDKMIVMVGQEMQMVRRIYMNAEHPKNVKPSFFGHSVGRWDGDTLIVDTVGIRNGNSTRSVQERIRKTNSGQNLEATLIENGRQGRVASVYWNPGSKFMEWICEDADEFWAEDYK